MRFWLAVPGCGAFTVTFPISLVDEDESRLRQLQWNGLLEPAELWAERLQKELPGPGLRFHLGADGAVPLVSGKDFLVIQEAVGPGSVVPWAQLPGHVHMQLASFRPDAALRLELAFYGTGGSVGMFLLQSPSTLLWRYLPRSVQEQGMGFYSRHPFRCRFGCR